MEDGPKKMRRECGGKWCMHIKDWFKPIFCFFYLLINTFYNSEEYFNYQR